MVRFISIFITLLLFFSPTPVYAHAFGQQYTLPVPFWLYAYGAAAAVVISFLVIGFFMRAARHDVSYHSRDISNFPLFKVLANKVFLKIVQAVSVGLLLLTIATGVFGVQETTTNFNMTFFWIIFVLGVAYLSAIFGNIFYILNPWRIIANAVDHLRKDTGKGVIAYPQSFEYYPALVLYFLFIWVELIWRIIPYELSLLLVVYTFINFFGVVLIGKKAWFTYCEFFSVFFGLLSKIALLEWKERRVLMRPPFVGLLNEQTEHFSLVVFIVFMLSSTAYDGFRATTVWWNLYFVTFAPLTYQLGDSASWVIGTAGLIAALLVFLIIYLDLLLLMKIIVKSEHSLIQLAKDFAFSLVPIALVYNLAHYYTLLVIQGQAIISLISDPFGSGLNLFGTAHVIPNIGLLSANFIWHSEVGFILLGHIAAIYLAHVIALRIFPSHKKAITSQFPMLALMVIYTVTGLWILSQPLTSGF